MRAIAVSTSLALGLLTAGTAHAGLAGSSVTLRYDYLGVPSTFDTWTVGAAVEATCTGGGAGNANVCALLNAPGATQTVDLGDLTISYLNVGASAAFSPGAPNGFNFVNLNPGFAIAGVGLSTSIPGLDLSRVTFTPDSVAVAMGSLVASDGQGYTLTLSPVPEPAGGLLMVAGLLAVTAAARRRR